jgi:hypothetical protein
LKLKCDILVSSLCFQIQRLYRYATETKGTVLITSAADMQSYSRGEVGLCRLNQVDP